MPYARGDNFDSVMRFRKHHAKPIHMRGSAVEWTFSPAVRDNRGYDSNAFFRWMDGIRLPSSRCVFVMNVKTRQLNGLFVPIFAIAVLVAGPASAQQIRIVSWNTANDVSGSGGDTHPVNTAPYTAPATGVLQAIGSLSVTPSAPAHPIDILALEESAINGGTGPNPTAQQYASILNSIYHITGYVAAPLNGTTDGSATGNGPSTLVYNSTTLQLVSETGIGTVSSTGPARQVLRFQFQPIGAPASASFYMYVDHFKASSGSTNENRRGAEATIINNDVNSLPANTPVVFAGDYNPTSGVTDQGYQGVVGNSGPNHGVDPLNPTNNLTQTWSSVTKYETESPATSAFFTGQSTGGLSFRDDFLLNSPGMLSGNGIHYVPGSFVTFGNTATFDASGNLINPATHTDGAAITTSSSSAFALELSGQYTSSQAAGVLTDLTEAADHLPVVADYNFTPVPEPSSLALAFAGALAGARFIRRRRP
jgi:PEP-CTERM motif